jgi:hypothetical protein
VQRALPHLRIAVLERIHQGLEHVRRNVLRLLALAVVILVGARRLIEIILGEHSSAYTIMNTADRSAGDATRDPTVGLRRRRAFRRFTTPRGEGRCGLRRFTSSREWCR